ncbi:MAG TPA: VOC family protein [Gemmatimonadales bacterium]
MATTDTSPGDTAAAGAAPYAVAPDGYRLPAELRLGPVRLQIGDLGRSLDYYERVLGLRAIQRSGAGATLGAQSDETSLIELRLRKGAVPVPRRGRLGLYHFALLLPDRAALGRLVAQLEALGVRIGASDHLVSEALYLNDPDGLGIEVYADRPRHTWRMNGPTLAMATDPLDLEDLVRASAGKAWTGAPAGTRIGHVHLHVGGLERAAAFYHTGLGLDRIMLDLPGALFLSAGGYHHHLGTNTWASGASPAAPGDARLLEWTIQLPRQSDIGDAARSLADSGYQVEREEGDAVVDDPWGTTLRLTRQ